MKTLDEQIKRMETAATYLPEVEPWKMLRNDDLTDALHYLKEYREKQYELSAMFDEYQAAVAEEPNEPLDWEELCKMEGKPVWIEEYYPVMEDEVGATEDEGEFEGHWDIVRKVYREQIIFYVQGMTNHKDWMGIGWQAYRKERS